MSKDYRVLEVTKGNGEPDQHGNESYWVKFEGAQNSCLMVAKRAPEVGGTEHGDVTEQTSKAGKTYYRFKRAQREDGQTFHSEAPSFKGSAKKEWQPRDDDRIVAQWAIGQALTKGIAAKVFDTETIESYAKEFYAMVDRVKGNDPKEQRGIEEKQSTGYAAFKAAGGQVKSEVLASELPPVDAYSDVQIEEFDDEPIDLSQIPF